MVDYINRFNISNLCKSFASLKQKGFQVSETILCLILLHFTGLSVSSLVKSDLKDIAGSAKDNYYRLKNNPLIDWRKLQLLFCKRFVTLIKDPTEPNVPLAPKCFIVDDTTMEKTGRTIEFIGRVFDHVTKGSVLGFKLLVLGFWDGKSFLGLDFSLHREKGKNPKRPYGMTAKERSGQYHKTRDKKSFGNKRTLDLNISKVNSAIRMIKRAVKMDLMHRMFYAIHGLCVKN